MKIYTKTGDSGETSLVTGTRVKKNNNRLEAYGTIDELNSFIGLIRSGDIDQHTTEILIWIQDKLFIIGSNLSKDFEVLDLKIPEITEDFVAVLESEMDMMLEMLPPLQHFILPGGNTLVSHCHIARTICRRAERRIVQLSDETNVPEIIIKFINRLSDYFFVLARKFSLDLKVEEVTWFPKR
jgi:cob(I)alamin adenosyltransferase